MVHKRAVLGRVQQRQLVYGLAPVPAATLHLMLSDVGGIFLLRGEVITNPGYNISLKLVLRHQMAWYGSCLRGGGPYVVSSRAYHTCTQP